VIEQFDVKAIQAGECYIFSLPVSFFLAAFFLPD
jgi:hypothetical protein